MKQITNIKKIRVGYPICSNFYTNKCLFIIKYRILYNSYFNIYIYITIKFLIKY